MIPEMTVEDLKKKLDAKERFELIDVREPHEFAASKIPGAKLIPLGELPKRLAEIDKSVPVVVHCRSGARSARAVTLLRENGYDATNVAGGILAWADHIDPTFQAH